MNTETVYSGCSEADLVMASTGEVGPSTQVTGFATTQEFRGFRVYYRAISQWVGGSDAWSEDLSIWVRMHGFAAMRVPLGGVLSGQEIQKAKSHLVYHIGTGDVLQISVYQHPEWSTTVVVRATGEINVPWHRDAKVAGLSVEAASTLLREQLQSVIDWSCVTLTVKQRKGSWVLEKEPFFVDVPSPGQSSAARVS